MVALLNPQPPQVSLDDKYRLDRSCALLSGRQALVRLPIAQRELDRAQGLKTAGLISGYRGSPLGSYDLDLWRASALLNEHDIVFQPGLNEDLAMTALAGVQQLDFFPGRKFDGVFGIWYGKGPGVDRSGDAIKHANLQGVAPRGGIILAVGDDHTGKSSTTAHQSDLTLASWGVPVLYPSSVSEILEFGLAGLAMSRFSGLLVSLKLVNETADGTQILQTNAMPAFVLPQIPTPEGGVHIRRETLATQQQDLRLHRHKLPRAQAFARANRLDRVVFGSNSARFVIATAGKAFPDVLAALSILGVTDHIAQQVGIGVYKIGMIYPLEPLGLEEATRQADEILFVEEKRAHIETQAARILYNHDRRPRVSGKSNPDGTFLLPPDMPLDPQLVAVAVAKRLLASFPTLGGQWPELARRFHEAANATPAADDAPLAARRPAFCPGCPHNTSTVVPEGSLGGTGIGCHGMVLFHPERNPLPIGHMGAEGAQWIGLAPFTETSHIFQNLGDGTYSHSGSLAIRAAVLAKVNVTYKILLNDAVAMTGGQPVEGHLTAKRVIEQVRAEGVGRVVLVTDQIENYAGADSVPAGTELKHRDELAQVQESLRKESGVTVIVYQQTCAAEKRRRRKINQYPDPDQRIFINSLVCEGCGDCSAQSNCLAIQPLETDLGRKREIDQSACNKDFSCVKGFCPSFVTVKGPKLHREPGAGASLSSSAPTAPALPAIGEGFDLIIAGIGGTGVVTVSAVLGMAARIEGLGASLYDMTGLSQKGGQVFSHIRLRRDANTPVPARVGANEAHVILACDLIAAVQPEVLKSVAPGRTRIFGNLDLVATANFQRQRDLAISAETLVARLQTASGTPPALIPASSLSQQLLGDSIAANILMLGFAWQSGAIPLRLASLETAISLNGKSVDANLKAFNAGRNAAALTSASAPRSIAWQDYVADRCTDLRAYWNEAYERRYQSLVNRVAAAAMPLAGGEALVWAVARSAYKLMAYKDEFEIGRLYTDGRFRAALSAQFSDLSSIQIHLAPPLLSSVDKRTGRPRKYAFGGWIMPCLHLLRRLKGLRETPLDIFGYTDERRLERELRDSYEAVIQRMAATLSTDNLAQVIEVAQTPLAVRGFGHVKQPSAAALRDRLRALNTASS